jgi:hypothetical protein
MRERGKARSEINGSTAEGLDHGRADVSVRSRDDCRQDDKDIFIGQVIGYPDFVEGVLRCCFCCVRRHLRGSAGRVELDAETHGCQELSIVSGGLNACFLLDKVKKPLP